MKPRILLWDFGDTLVDERWMRRAPDGCSGWEAAWVATMAELADGWNVGEVAAARVYEALATRTGLSADAVARHARACCEQITVHEEAWRVATERRQPQAIVTVNPDLFTDVVVPACALTSVFDVIVASHAEGTDDKVALCEIALDRLGYLGPRSDALLIDNRADLVEAWREAGGAGYWYRDDDEFASDFGSAFTGRQPWAARPDP
jgi:FMN phosphatase YigB (HAD superfamily)